jgi:hypothetical protein
VKRELLGAKKLIERNGWSGPEFEPYCLRTETDGHGQKTSVRCWEWDEGLESFSVLGALIEARAYPEGWHALEAVVAPAHHSWWNGAPTPAELVVFCKAAVDEVPLEQWLKDPNRTREDVLRVFTTAVLRSGRTAQ